MQLPLMPTFAATSSCVPMGLAAFTLVGGALYNPLDAKGRDAPAYEILNACGGHPQQHGQYHYHDYAPCLTKGSDQNGHSTLIAYALDGFGVFGGKDVGGRDVSNKDLDECHGHTGPVLWNDKIQSIYHYHMNNEYPYAIGCFRGVKVKSASIGKQENLSSGGGQRKSRQLSGGQGLQQQGPNGLGATRSSSPSGRYDPISAVARELGLDANDLRRAVGRPPPNFARAADVLNIDEKTLQAVFRKHRPR